MDRGEINGIGGWLLLLTINLFCVAIFSLFIILFVVYLIFLEATLFRGITLVLTLSILILTIWTIITEFKKKKTFLKLCITSLWITSLISAGYEIYSYSPTDLIETIAKIADMFLPLVLAVLWTVYLFKSKRVKNTFNNS